MITSPKKILDFWFHEAGPEKWFAKDAAFDQEIRDLFLETYNAERGGTLSSWPESADSYLALILLFDQFSRNMFRDSKKAFESDIFALKISKKAIEKGFDKKMNTSQKKFLYMPFMHSECLEDQKESIQLFKSLKDNETLKYALQHADIIKNFGRFPHRNKILNRQSSEEEILFLQTPGSSF